MGIARGTPGAAVAGPTRADTSGPAPDDLDRPLAVYQQLADHYRDALSYRKLASAAAAQGRRALAVDTLRDASLRLLRSGRRPEAIGLLEDAVVLAPTELAIHRRLVAAYVNADDGASAGREHVRFIGDCIDAGDLARAIAEIDYARGTIGDSTDLRELERSIWSGEARGADPLDLHSASDPGAETAPRTPVVQPGPELTSEERALIWMRRRDGRAGVECAAAVRELLGARKTLAAADLLLAYVASGLPGREAQRMLISLERAFGRADIAAEKAELLARLLELDGDLVAAGDVRRVALAR